MNRPVPPQRKMKPRRRLPRVSGKGAALGATDQPRHAPRVAATLADLYATLLSPATSVASIATLVLDQARRFTKSEHGYAATIDPTTGDLVPQAATSLLEGQWPVSGAEEPPLFSRDPEGRYRGPWGHALNTRTPFFTNAPEQQHSSRGMLPGHTPLSRFLSMPVLIGDELVGQLALANAATSYTGSHLAIVGRLAEVFALAIRLTRAEGALRESQARLQGIFRVAPMGIGLVRDRVLRWVNDTLCGMLGYAEDELIGRSARILYPTEADFARAGEEGYAQIRDGGRGTIETRWQRKDTVVRDILLSGTPLDPSDRTAGVIFTALDITERKHTEADLQSRTEQLDAPGHHGRHH